MVAVPLGKTVTRSGTAEGGLTPLADIRVAKAALAPRRTVMAVTLLQFLQRETQRTKDRMNYCGVLSRISCITEQQSRPLRS
jgi:hypothetical protein